MYYRETIMLSINSQILFTTLIVINIGYSSGSVWETQLYEDLLFQYNKMPRPVQNSTDLLTIYFGTSLLRIVNVDEKNQVFTTSIWLEMHWMDAKLQWTPSDYNGVQRMHINADKIWTPDIVLYNNAAGDPDIQTYNEAMVDHTGRVIWKPPAIYKSFCKIDVTWFPYDVQKCDMKFGTWTYTGTYVDLQFLPWYDVVESDGNQFLIPGMDLHYFQTSATWDLLNLTAKRSEEIYTSCCGPAKYVDITFKFLLRRKALFYTCNLIIPCFLISTLTTFVFYLPDKKVTFAISILVTLTVFFLVLIEVIPPTSEVIPMFGQYLLYTMIIVTVSILISVVSINFNYRTGATHEMPRWMRKVFMVYLARILCMTPPFKEIEDIKEADPILAQIPSLYGSTFDKPDPQTAPLMNSSWPPPPSPARAHKEKELIKKRPKMSVKRQIVVPETHNLHLRAENDDERELRMHQHIIRRLLHNVRFISEHFRIAEEQEHFSEEWRFVSTVLDRLFLVVYVFLNIGALFIIIRAPSLRDTRLPLGPDAPESPLSHSRLS